MYVNSQHIKNILEQIQPHVTFSQRQQFTRYTMFLVVGQLRPSGHLGGHFEENLPIPEMGTQARNHP